MTEFLQNTLPYNPFQQPRLPGVKPLDMAEWLKPDEACAAQLAERDRLIADHRDAVIAMEPEALEPARELMEVVAGQLYGGAPQCLRRTDGREVVLDRADPLAALGRIAQQDFCILEKRGSEHVLTAAVLCFPASWSLEEKFGRPLLAIHEPVGEYSANIAARVQRLFDGVQPGRPLWRFNALWYRDPALFQPRRSDARRAPELASGARYLRSELQSILRLQRTKAVVFSIHTRVLRRADVIAQWGEPLPDPAEAI